MGRVLGYVCLRSEERPRLETDLEIISQYIVDGGQDVTRRRDRRREGTGYDRPQEEEMVKEIEEGWPVRRVQTIEAKGKNCFHQAAMSRYN